jgi:hypothetical protein
MPPRPQFNMRMDLRTALLLEALGHRLNLGTPAVVRLAIARLAAAEGVTEADAPSVQLNRTEYLVECPVCGMRFMRDDPQQPLHPHQAPDQHQPCPGSGTVGQFVGYQGPGTVRHPGEG